MVDVVIAVCELMGPIAAASIAIILIGIATGKIRA